MMDFLFIGGIGMQEVLLIALVVLLFFGGKKIPGVHAFRDGLNNVEGNTDASNSKSSDNP